MMVPGSFDATTRYGGYRGSGVFRKKFYQTPNSHARILFEACGMWCRVYVDGKDLYTHANGYTAFWVDVPSSSESNREIVVIADVLFYII